MKLNIYPKPKGALEKIGDKIAVSMHLFAIPTRVGNHNCAYALDNSVVVARHVSAQQPVPISYCVILIYSPGGAAITHKVFCTSQNLIPITQHISERYIVSEESNA
jgi:hypothetical protein